MLSSRLAFGSNRFASCLWPQCANTAAVPFRFFFRKKSFNFVAGGSRKTSAWDCPSSGEITRRSALLKASNGAQEFGLLKTLRVHPHEPVVDRELLGDSTHGTTP